MKKARKLYYFVLIFGRDSKGLTVSCQYDARRMNEKKVNEMVMTYIKAIKLVVDRILERDDG